MTERGKALSVLAMNTLAFTACFAVWMMYGVLVTYFVDTRLYAFDKAQMGWLIGVPVLTGSLLRLPAGVLADRFGGRVVFFLLMLVSAAAAFLTSYADGYAGFLVGGLGFGIAGASFAVGVAYTSVFFPKEQQGTALGIFGMGNVGAAVTSLFAPRLLGALTEGGAHPEAWRQFPRLYALALVATAAVFWAFTHTRLAGEGQRKTVAQRLAPLRVARVWRFGLYYLLLFGGFVALAQWLIPYYVNVYSVSVASAGALAAAFSLPSGLFRAVGGWLSDRFGARKVMYWVLSGCTVCCLLLAVPRMDVFAPGEGVMAEAEGAVGSVTRERIVVGERSYALRLRPEAPPNDDGQTLVWPRRAIWHEPVVKEGDRVAKRQLLARGVTHIFFQANRRIFTGIALGLAIFMGIGMAAVYKHIPTYFPNEVGVVGGIVGVLGGLGGFLFPTFFGSLLEATGIWTTCWIFFFALALVCLVWMHLVIQRVMAQGAPQYAREMETTPELARQMEDLAREMSGLAEKLRKPARGGA
jgi:NNP family nitrate/nitrite transporter-like MFS transporter